ncbi:MAG: PilZ domain-containing protein [Chitinivibrionia bacterium]|nr:PilZ domain-containing protein [Chitinivibrionia bacterium]
MGNTALKQNNRRVQREVLCFYLKVIDLKTGKEIGRVVDITSEGMMLCGNVALDDKKIYGVRIILAKSVFDMALGNLDVSVQVRWSKPDANPSLTLTGMLFLDLDEKGKKTVEKLVAKIGMKHSLDVLTGNEEEEEEY